MRILFTTPRHILHPYRIGSWRQVPISFFCCLITTGAFSQHRQVCGNVINPFTNERIPFASVMWKKARTGVITDSTGHFRIAPGGFTHDTLVVSYSGFASLYIPVNPMRDTAELTLFLDQKRADSVVVKVKYNRGYFWWKKIVKNKPRNDPYQSNTYSCELYNKLELDLNNINRDGFSKHKLLKPFGFILDNVDSASEKKPFLPIFITESLSDYYHSAKPYQTREEIKAVQTNGIKNEMVLHYLEGLNPRVNVYENYMSLFGKEFISPLSNAGDNYYNYRGADTQYISGQRYLHLFFSPKRDGENTFSGDCWIHYKTWAIRKINLEISPAANINYVNRMSIIQEFVQQNDSVWVFAKDKFITELSPLKKDKLSLIARKTSMYRNVRANEPYIAARLIKNTRKEEVITGDSAEIRDATYWQEGRHEPLSNSEAKVYKMIDTLHSMPLFTKYTNTISFIIDGHKKLGKIEIGPWYKWISGNQHEKLRMRFDIGTTEKFSPYLRLHGYLAYGFADRAFKGQMDATYTIPGNSGYTVQASYLHDLDNGRARYSDEELTADNIFNQMIRRPGIKQKFLQVDEIKMGITKEWHNNISAQVSLTRSSYETFHPLPPKWLIAFNQRDLTNTELGFKLRYAPGENKVVTHRRNFRFSGSNPVFEARYSLGTPGLLEGKYAYQKVNLMVTQDFRIPRWGKINYRIYGGKIFGNEALPFMLLELHPGNEVYYYNKQAFNLMNRFEYFSDRYAGFTVEHNFEKKLLNLLPFMRKINVRQFWNLKAVWGDLSAANKKLNCSPDLGSYRLRSLQGKSYVELGTGFDNIFKYFRVDLVWRFAPEQKRGAYENHTTDFGVFGSFHLQF